MTSFKFSYLKFLLQRMSRYNNYNTRIVLLKYRTNRTVVKPGLHLNANVVCENEAIVQCRCVTEARQTAFSYVTNVRQTAKCYPSTVGTSKRIRIQYIYVGPICCLGKCRIVYECTILFASPLVRMRHSHSYVNPA